MKIFTKNSFIILAVVFVFGLTALPATALAAIDLGTAGSFGVLSSTFTANGDVTAVTGDVGYTTLDGSGTITVTGGATSTPSPTQAGIDQGLALEALNALSCDYSFGSAQDLSLLSQPLAPGVYCVTGAQSIGTGGIILDGEGTYVFRSTGALDTVADSHVTLTGGASECNVFWTPLATTLGANTSFAGTVIDTAAITVGSTVTWLGRALSYGKTVTTDTDIITAPASCVVSPESAASGTLQVIKTVVNSYAGTATSSDFILHVKLAGSEVDGSPLAGTTTPGNSYSLAAGDYIISETASSSYVATFSGDCDSDGNITLTSGATSTCTITNVDIAPPVVVPVVVIPVVTRSRSGSSGYSYSAPPLIDVVKVPSPLALPNGPGLVTYTYTLRNKGTVSLTNIKMVDDSCSIVTLISGDANNNDKLDVNETWIYRCSSMLSKTHTNIVVATGWANGMVATDIANSTVAVGVPGLPNTGLVTPLIHVTKTSNPLSLPAGGGMVVYTEKVSNPGINPLNNVSLTDDKCSPLKYVSGDTNRDSKLDVNETWTYTCVAVLFKTTTNYAIASGEVNGVVTRDLAVATVTVTPNFPNTGLSPLSYASDQKISRTEAIATFLRSLDLSAEGDDVVALQTILEQKNLLSIPSGVAKGYFGSLTRSAIIRYQESVGLPMVGVFGPLTRAKIISDLEE